MIINDLMLFRILLGRILQMSDGNSEILTDFLHRHRPSVGSSSSSGFHASTLSYSKPAAPVFARPIPSSWVSQTFELEISNCRERAGFYISAGRPVPVGIQKPWVS
jgi:hypothetical protein